MNATELLGGLTLLLQVIVLGILVLQQNQTRVGQHLASLEKGQDRLEKLMRDELGQARQEAAQAAQAMRDELATWIRTFGEQTAASVEQLTKSLGDTLSLARQETAQAAQETRKELNTQFQGLREQLATTLDAHNQHRQGRFDGFAQATRESLEAHDRRTICGVADMAEQQKAVLDSFSQQLLKLTEMNEQKLEHLRETVEQKLTALQADNSQKLEEMRATVDEKLHRTLEQRLGESFKLVSERLEQVHQGLGEMQALATGVGDLKKVLSNVKTRGTMGEIQLGALLEQILSPEQYRAQVAVRDGSGEKVDFAVVLPGKDDTAEGVLLPIDAKFPLEDYQRLLDAEEVGDPVQAADAARLLEARVKIEAKSLREKYINPPATTDFVVLFLPVEGLFAEVLRRPGLWDLLQREYRVVVTGPTTLTALLSSLQMGFRTLAIQKRSSEVWRLLGAVKTEFGKFGDVLEKTQKKLQEASNTIDTAAVRSRAIERKLRQVEAAPAEDAPALLGDLESAVSESE